MCHCSCTQLQRMTLLAFSVPVSCCSKLGLSAGSHFIKLASWSWSGGPINHNVIMDVYDSWAVLHDEVHLHLKHVLGHLGSEWHCLNWHLSLCVLIISSLLFSSERCTCKKGLQGVCLCKNYSTSQLMGNLLHCLGLVVHTYNDFIQVPCIYARLYFT